MPWEQGVCHGDFHPGNVLFEGTRPAGIVDWSLAREAPVLYDVGRCRCALATWPGGEAAELFLAHYARRSGRPSDGLACWDVVAGAMILSNRHDWMAMYHSLGVNLSAELISQRIAAFIDAALTRLDT